MWPCSSARDRQTSATLQMVLQFLVKYHKTSFKRMFFFSTAVFIFHFNLANKLNKCTKHEEDWDWAHFAIFSESPNFNTMGPKSFWSCIKCLFLWFMGFINTCILKIFRLTSGKNWSKNWSLFVISERLNISRAHYALTIKMCAGFILHQPSLQASYSYNQVRVARGILLNDIFDVIRLESVFKLVAGS